MNETGPIGHGDECLAHVNLEKEYTLGARASEQLPFLLEVLLTISQRYPNFDTILQAFIIVSVVYKEVAYIVFLPIMYVYLLTL